MQHRDEIIIQKVPSELNLGSEMLGDASLESFFLSFLNDLALVQKRSRICSLKTA